MTKAPFFNVHKYVLMAKRTVDVWKSVIIVSSFMLHLAHQAIDFFFKSTLLLRASKHRNESIFSAAGVHVTVTRHN
jgi:hypothetical protein